VKSLHDDRTAGSPKTRLRVTIRSAFNLPFKQWDTVFPNAACAVALIDRLTHHAEIISIEGESYRKREAEQAQKRKQEQKPKR
jgi:DNA replication protein DnaC